MPSTALLDGNGSDWEGVGIGMAGCLDDDASLELVLELDVGVGLGGVDNKRLTGIGWICERTGRRVCRNAIFWRSLLCVTATVFLFNYFVRVYMRTECPLFGCRR